MLSWYVCGWMENPQFTSYGKERKDPVAIADVTGPIKLTLAVQNKAPILRQK